MASKTLASLIVRIGADVTGVTAGLNTLDKRVRSTKKQFSTVTDSTLRWQSALGVLAGAAGIGYAAKRIFDLGSGIEETASKFRTVFGPATAEAQAFLDDFANTAGLTNTKAQELVATTGAIVQGMGYSQKASADFSKEIIKLAGDLTSFNDVPIEETARALQSALTGERESLKRLGIVILETDVQQKALMQTGKATAKELTQQEKATATLALVTERAGVAVGDLARTMDSPANKARALSAAFLDVRDSAATAMLPALVEVMNEIGGSTENLKAFAAELQASSPIIAAWAKFTIEAFKFAALAIAAPIRIAFNLGEALGNLAQIVHYTITGAWGKAREAAKNFAGQLTDMGDVVGGITGAFDAMRVASGMAQETQKDFGTTVDTVTAGMERQTVAATALAQALAGVKVDHYAANNLMAGKGFTLPTAMLGPGGKINMPNVPGAPGTGGADDVWRGRAGTAGGVLGAAGQALPGKLGAVASSAGAVASAFASGGPLLGGIAVAGLAFKGISGLFASGKSQMELFLDSVKAATQELSAKFGLLDIEDATRQFTMTLLQAQGVFKGTQFEYFFKGLTLENVQEKIDELILGGGPGGGVLNLGSDDPVVKAFIDFIQQLETIGDRATSELGSLADAASDVTEALRNVPAGFKIALARFNADAGTIPNVDTAVPGSKGGGFTPNFAMARSSAPMNVQTINVYGVKDPADFLDKLGQQVQWQRRTGAYVLQTAF